MSVVVLAVNTAPPPAGDGNGWDKMELSLTSRGASVKITDHPNMFLVRGGVEGLGMPPMKHTYDELNTMPGAWYRETKIGQRKPYLEVYLYHDGTTVDFARWQTQFWNLLHPRHPVRWTCTVPGVSTRHLDMRQAPGGSWKPDMDPTYFGWAQYGIDFLGEGTSLWYETPSPVRFLSSGSMPFHGGTAPDAPIVNISSGIDTAHAFVDNPGDEDTFGVFTLNGPFPQAVVGIGDRVIEVPFALGSGQWLRLDGNPLEQSAIDHNGVDRYPELGEADWDGLRVPPGRVELTVNLFGGTGFVDFDRRHHFHQAYGWSST